MIYSQVQLIITAYNYVSIMVNYRQFNDYGIFGINTRHSILASHKDKSISTYRRMQRKYYQKLY